MSFRELSRERDVGGGEVLSTAIDQLLDVSVPVSLARAPGRLDVMGGIADYSGSLVLELPLARATFAALQPRAEPRCSLVSLREGGVSTYAVDLAELTSGAFTTPESLRRTVAGDETDGWAAYVLGLVHVCLHHLDPPADPRGFRLVISSDVPEGKGVASSAALEVAAMMAIAHHFGIDLTPEEVAAWCQWVENRVVGAPCGIMDQMTAAAGRSDHLLRLRCQPADVEGHVPVPDGLRFFGIDSGIRHAVSGADYGTVRAAAFMGLALLGKAAEGAPPAGFARASGSTGGTDPWSGYLANIAPDEYGRMAHVLPETMTGAGFLDRGLETADPVTIVERDRSYPVRAATAHPIMENHRVERFATLLAELAATGREGGGRVGSREGGGRVGSRESADAAVAAGMGELMYASHASYSACGLGSDGTDRLVEMVRAAGPDRGLFGAKITGGGSGGTVAVLGRADALDTVREIARQYERETGRAAEVFVRSGPGAAESGVRTVAPETLRRELG